MGSGFIPTENDAEDKTQIRSICHANSATPPSIPTSKAKSSEEVACSSFEMVSKINKAERGDQRGMRERGSERERDEREAKREREADGGGRQAESTEQKVKSISFLSSLQHAVSVGPEPLSATASPASSVLPLAMKLTSTFTQPG